MITEEIAVILFLSGIAALFSGFAIITFITISLFFKDEVSFHENRLSILVFELFLVLLGWFTFAVLILSFLGGS